MASYYHTFSKMKAGATGVKRIGNIISKIRDIDRQQVGLNCIFLGAKLLYIYEIRDILSPALTPLFCLFVYLTISFSLVCHWFVYAHLSGFYRHNKKPNFSFKTMSQNH